MRLPGKIEKKSAAAPPPETPAKEVFGETDGFAQLAAVFEPAPSRGEVWLRAYLVAAANYDRCESLGFEPRCVNAADACLEAFNMRFGAPL